MIDNFDIGAIERIKESIRMAWTYRKNTKKMKVNAIKIVRKRKARRTTKTQIEKLRKTYKW